MGFITNAPEDGFLPGTTDLADGGLAGQIVSLYSLQQELIPPPGLL